MATVFIQKRKRKNRNSYLLYYKDPNTGKLKYYSSCSRRKYADSLKAELVALIDSGKLPQKKVRMSFLTFSQVAESLKEAWKKKNSRKQLSDITLKDYLQKLSVLERRFGKRILCQITQEEILEFRDEQIEKNSVVTANRYIAILKFVFKHGLELNAIVENPVVSISLLSERAYERNEFLKPAELEKLIQATQKTRGKYYLPAIIFLGAEHGASKQEILSLRWGKIDFEWNKKGIITLFRTKNKMLRTEFLMPRTKQALLSWKSHLEQKRKKMGIEEPKSDLVFCRIDGTPLNEFKKSWRRALELAGISNFHFHDLRHTYCSNLLLSGANLKDVKELIGHRDIKMTDRYSHLTMSHKSALQEQLAAHYSK